MFLGETMPAKKTFWERVEKTDGCWIWKGGRRGGYGRLRVDGRWVSAHVVAYEEANGPLQPGQKVLHRCDHPPCVRPDHLFAGSQKDNVDDAAGPIEFFDDPLPDPKTDVAAHQRRWSDADKVGITVAKCWNPYIAKIYPLTSNDTPGVWMPTPEIGRRWPHVDERRTR